MWHRWSRTASHLPDVLPHVLNHHLVGSNGLHGEETPVVDVRLAESYLLLTELKGAKTRNGWKSFVCTKTLSLLLNVPPWEPNDWITFSWLNLSRSLSHAKDESSRRCSDRRSEPALVEAWTCAGMLIPCNSSAPRLKPSDTHMCINYV